MKRDDRYRTHRSLQHTEVSAIADRERSLTVLDECIEYNCDGVMVQPCWVPLAVDRLEDTDTSVCTALGYPLGGDRTLTKQTGIRDAIAAGADEIDVMANIGLLKSDRDDAFKAELEALVEASGSATIKLMAELGGLTDNEAEREIEYAVEAGFDYVKNSSGFGVGGQASVGNIAFIRDQVPESVNVKARYLTKRSTSA